MEAIRQEQAEAEVLEIPEDGIAVPADGTAAARRPRLTVVHTESFYRRRGKRLLDIVLGGALFVCALPLLAIVALAVLVMSGRPAFYSSARVGRNGRPFRVRKFRTMISDADRVLESWRELRPDLAAAYGENFKLRDDPRITPLGRLLRKTSLDELPQFWNVLRGEMSLVGPRPVPERELEEMYGAMAGTVVSVRPGMTGLWQINGRSDVSYSERVRLDSQYAASVEIRQDVRILALTLPAVLLRRGAE